MKLHHAGAIPLILASATHAFSPKGDCYSRVRDSMSVYDTATFQTPAHCMQVCGKLGFEYAALRGVWCHCGEKPSEKYEVSSDDCDTECAGWARDICGGQKAWSVYSAKSFLDEPSSSTVTTSSTLEIASSSTSAADSTESQTATTSPSRPAGSTSKSSSPAESSTELPSNASSEAASTASTTPTSSLPSALGTSSSTGVTPTSSTSGANRRYSFLF